MQIGKNERINLLGRSHGYFPAAFRWRGRRFDVAAVEKCWMERRPAARRLFRVRCADGVFVLEQSMADDTWQVSRWPLALLLPRPKSGATARFPLPRRQRRPVRPTPAPLAPGRGQRSPAGSPAAQRGGALGSAVSG